MLAFWHVNDFTDKIAAGKVGFLTLPDTFEQIVHLLQATITTWLVYLTTKTGHYSD